MGSYAVWLNDTIHRRQRWFACCFYAGNFPPATSGSGYTIMSARGLDKRPGGEIVSSNGQKSDKVVGQIFTISAVRRSRGRESPPYSLCLADRAPHLARATVN